MLPDKVRCTESWTTASILINQNTHAPFFETTIRYLLAGGLLRFFALSREPILLSRADNLGQLLLPVFNATPSGLPAYSVGPQT